MFGWLARKTSKSQAVSGSGVLASQVPGEVFTWPKGAVLTAVDEVVLAIPKALFEPDKPMRDFVFGSDDMGISFASDDTLLIRLQAGMSLRLAKSVQCYIVADDKKPRSFWVKLPQPKAAPQ